MTHRPARQLPWHASLAAAGVFAVLSGCASYQPHPLEKQSPLAADLDVIQVQMAER